MRLNAAVGFFSLTISPLHLGAFPRTCLAPSTRPACTASARQSTELTATTSHVNLIDAALPHPRLHLEKTFHRTMGGQRPQAPLKQRTNHEREERGPQPSRGSAAARRQCEAGWLICARWEGCRPTLGMGAWAASTAGRLRLCKAGTAARRRGRMQGRREPEIRPRLSGPSIRMSGGRQFREQLLDPRASGFLNRAGSPWHESISRATPPSELVEAHLVS
jgi:hypothetical protein